MNRIRYIKNILLIFLLMISSLFIYDNVYAASSTTDETILPSCTYEIKETIDGKEISGDFTIAYFKNNVYLWNREKKNKASSTAIGSNSKVKLSSDAKSLFKKSDISFECPPSVNVNLSTKKFFGKKYTFTVTTKTSDNSYTAKILADRSITPYMNNNGSTTGNKIDTCSDSQLSKMKSELNSNFENKLNTPVYSRVKELSNLGKYSNASNGQPALTTIGVVQSKTSEIIAYYNLLLNGDYDSSKQSIIEKYRSACSFDDNVTPLTYIKDRETQLLSAIESVGKNRASMAERWMKEENISEETISEQKELYESGVKKYSDTLNESITKSSSNASSTVNNVASQQQQLSANCGLIDQGLMDIIEEVYGWIKVIVPIALICFGVFDFSVPVMSGDKDALSKATSRFIKRCIIAIIIFFVPLLVRYLLDAFNSATGKDISTCGLATIIRR